MKSSRLRWIFELRIRSLDETSSRATADRGQASGKPRAQAGRLFRLVCLVQVAWLAAGCAYFDNAEKLSRSIKRATAATRNAESSAVQRFVYEPDWKPDRPYFLVFFSGERTTRADVEAAGLPRSLAARVFAELDFLSVGEPVSEDHPHPMLLVVQEDRQLTWSVLWTRFAYVPELLVIEASGPVELVVAPGEDGSIVRLAD